MLKTIYIVAAGLLLSPLTSWAQINRAPLMTLAEMHGKFRPLLIFHSQSQPDPGFTDQLEITRKHKPELDERDVIVLPMPGVADSTSVPPGEELRLRRRFHVVADQFTVILVGKDGGEKFRSRAPVTIEKLRSLID